MGMPGPGSKNYQEKNTGEKLSSGNPDPAKFIIRKFYESKGHTVLFMVYPGCRNYEGSKILVFKNKTYNQIFVMNKIDPHFFPFSNLFARFEPTYEGFKAACNLIDSL